MLNLEFLTARCKDEKPFELVSINGANVYMTLRFVDNNLYKVLPDHRGLVYVNYLGFNDMLNSVMRVQERSDISE